MLPYICIQCRNILKDSKCKAFPKGIPETILTGKNNHSKPLPEQNNNIIFDPIDKK